MRRSTPADFWQRSEGSGQCLVWTGAVNEDGYGLVGYQGRGYAAHRLAWILAHGPIPIGQCVLHRCDNPPCVRPDHLWLGTHADNMADMRRKGRRRGISAIPRSGEWNRPRGEANHAHKLTVQQVIRLRSAWSGGASKRHLAIEFGVSRPTVKEIVEGRTWRDVALHGERP
jgi:hypothetical protein